MAGLKLQDLTWGLLDDMSDSNQHQLTGDRRRTGTLTMLQQAAALAYSPDAIGTRDEYNGFIVSHRPTNYATYQNPGSILQEYVILGNFAAPAGNDSAQQTAGRYENLAYKVYIPELNPQPAPRGANDPVLRSYPDIYSSVPSREALPLGSLVVVKYGDPIRLKRPTIISVVEMGIGIENISVDKEGKVLASAFYQGRIPGTMGNQGSVGAAGSYSGGPMPPLDGRCRRQYPGNWRNSWTNANPEYKYWKQPGGAALYIGTATAAAVGKKFTNAKLGKADRADGVSILTTIPSADNNGGSNFQILTEMVQDYKNLKAAYEKAFAADGAVFEVNNSYRGYGQQDRLYKTARAAAGHSATSPRTKPPTAYPGTSQHGWGAALDLQSTKMFLTDEGKSLGGGTAATPCKVRTKYFRWLNRYAPSYNFVFSVRKESWHANWTRLDTVFEGFTSAYKPWTMEGLANGPADLVVNWDKGTNVMTFPGATTAVATAETPEPQPEAPEESTG
jgi:hypothetical protein